MKAGLFVILSFLVFPILPGYTQTNPDSLFTHAKELAYRNQYDDALVICRELMLEYPAKDEYVIFSARLYSWIQDYPNSRLLLKPLKQNAEVLDVLSNIELWSGNTEEAIKICDQALLLENTDSVNFILKKARALEQAERPQEAVKALEPITNKNPVNKDVKYLDERLKDKLSKNKISLGYLNNSFNNPYSNPWQFGFIEYKRNIPGCPISGRLNYGNVRSAPGYQFEMDAYPVLKKGTYLYLNAGTADASGLFPKYKVGGDIYQKILSKMELSLGLRYMNFNPADVFIYTGYLGLYHANYWFSYRVYSINNSMNVYLSHTLSARAYYNNEQNYVSLNLIAGAAPFYYSFIGDIARTNTYGAGLEAQFKIGRVIFIKPWIMYEYEEYFPGQFRNRFDLQLILSKKF